MPFWAAVFLVLALLVGQLGVIQHDVAHAGDLHHTCDKDFACTQLSSAASTSVVEVPAAAGDAPQLSVIHDRQAPSSAPVVYRSRAPPVLHA